MWEVGNCCGADEGAGELNLYTYIPALVSGNLLLTVHLSLL